MELPSFWCALDGSRPDPADLTDQALDAMREEYPDLDAFPANDTLQQHRAIGHDVEFFSLDIANAASIRSFRTCAAYGLDIRPVVGSWR